MTTTDPTQPTMDDLIVECISLRSKNRALEDEAIRLQCELNNTTNRLHLNEDNLHILREETTNILRSLIDSGALEVDDPEWQMLSQSINNILDDPRERNFTMRLTVTIRSEMEVAVTSMRNISMADAQQSVIDEIERRIGDIRSIEWDHKQIEPGIHMDSRLDVGEGLTVDLGIGSITVDRVTEE